MRAYRRTIDFWRIVVSGGSSEVTLADDEAADDPEGGPGAKVTPNLKVDPDVQPLFGGVEVGCCNEPWRRHAESKLE